MKQLFISLALFLSFSLSVSGHEKNSSQEKPKVGDTLIVLENTGENYKHINFPRLNLIVKRGGIASYKSVYHTKVVVTEVIENTTGRFDVKLERVDGKKFFNHIRSVKANYEKALAKGELKANS
jgi:hypothetical protein